ncbi:MAG: hypothetical protein HUU35_07200, partial [Armatimonadetes bacterium]|nr:hypothetical protein [Armatimonadota bacterium]
MTKWGVGLAMVMLTLGPATAQCSGNPSCRDQSRYGDLQREASRLRWELHELDYSELATAEQRQAKRDELRNICEQVAIARRTQRV